MLFLHDDGRKIVAGCTQALLFGAISFVPVCAIDLF
jgi:hypothetical protein